MTHTRMYTRTQFSLSLYRALGQGCSVIGCIYQYRLPMADMARNNVAILIRMNLSLFHFLYICIPANKLLAMMHLLSLVCNVCSCQLHIALNLIQIIAILNIFQNCHSCGTMQDSIVAEKKAFQSRRQMCCLCNIYS